MVPDPLGPGAAAPGPSGSRTPTPGPGRSPDLAPTAVRHVVGRDRELELLSAALDCGAHVLLEGPPGTGKSTLLRTVAGEQHVPFVLVEGNAELTPGRLVGHFDPAQVLSQGYRPDVFVDGPLLEAMRNGALLYVEEVNRVPEETLNVLLTVMSEHEVNVPRLGRIHAAPGFRLVAAMNPFDAVGTARISGALYDRSCRITVGYQSAEDESAIVAQQAPPVPDDWRDMVVDMVRRTRDHAEIRIGSSVRGSLDVVKIASALAVRRDGDVRRWRTGLDASLVALSGRIRLQESCSRTPEDIVTELYTAVFGAQPADQADDEDGGPPGGA